MNPAGGLVRVGPAGGLVRVGPAGGLVRVNPAGGLVRVGPADGLVIIILSCFACFQPAGFYWELYSHFSTLSDHFITTHFLTLWNLCHCVSIASNRRCRSGNYLPAAQVATWGSWVYNKFSIKIQCHILIMYYNKILMKHTKKSMPCFPLPKSC